MMALYVRFNLRPREQQACIYTVRRTGKVEEETVMNLHTQSGVFNTRSSMDYTCPIDFSLIAFAWEAAHTRAVVSELKFKTRG